MLPIDKIELEIALGSELFSKIRFQIRYINYPEGPIELYGVYLMQKELLNQENTINNCNILSWLSQDTINEICEKIKEELYAQT